MSLDVSLQVVKPVDVYTANITHNLAPMARAVSLNFYRCLWEPEEHHPPITKAHQLLSPLREGLRMLKAGPEEYKKCSPVNGWGSYEGLVSFVEKYIEACEENPDAAVSADR